MKKEREGRGARNGKRGKEIRGHEQGGKSKGMKRERNGMRGQKWEKGGMK